jgi:1-deoxy-D-xylulose-5-phosphate reductoisomerase
MTTAPVWRRPIVARAGGPLRIGLFGCTGSIGRSTLDVVRANPERLVVVALAAGNNEAEVRRLAAELGVARIALGRPVDGILSGPGALRRLAGESECDVVVNAVVGAAGLDVTLGALEAGRHVALANKESLVMAGDLVMRLAREKSLAIRPIDSEHSALASCLRGRDPASIRRAILTASGGPFRGRPAGSFDEVTVEEALNHPTWSMGPKITIDSATLMNKGLEIIEAHQLFDLPAAKIGVLLHPQSLVHAMVEDHDGSIVMEMAPPDMRIPIQRSLLDDGEFAARLDPLTLPPITFGAPDRAAFPALDLALAALASGGVAPAVLNAANEVAVGAFLDRQIPFGAIAAVIAETLDGIAGGPAEDEAAIRHADAEARRFASERVSARWRRG